MPPGGLVAGEGDTMYILYRWKVEFEFQTRSEDLYTVKFLRVSDGEWIYEIHGEYTNLYPATILTCKQPSRGLAEKILKAALV